MQLLDPHTISIVAPSRENCWWVARARTGAKAVGLPWRRKCRGGDGFFWGKGGKNVGGMWRNAKKWNGGRRVGSKCPIFVSFSLWQTSKVRVPDISMHRTVASAAGFGADSENPKRLRVNLAQWDWQAGFFVDFPCTSGRFREIQ
jgi:hypothetical protein